MKLWKVYIGDEVTVSPEPRSSLVFIDTNIKIESEETVSSEEGVCVYVAVRARDMWNRHLSEELNLKW